MFSTPFFLQRTKSCSCLHKMYVHLSSLGFHFRSNNAHIKNVQKNINFKGVSQLSSVLKPMHGTMYEVRSNRNYHDVIIYAILLLLSSLSGRRKPVHKLLNKNVSEAEAVRDPLQAMCRAFMWFQLNAAAYPGLYLRGYILTHQLK